MPHSEAEAQTLLTPYMEEFGRIFPIAWERWESMGEKAPELRLQVCKRTRATLLHDFAVAAAKEIFGGRGPEIVLSDQPGFLLIIIKSALHIRLKKYRGPSGLTSGIQTGQCQIFESQKPLEGFPPATNCVHGYVLKQDGSGFAETKITCKTKKVTHWAIDVPMVERTADVERIDKVVRHETTKPGISSTLNEERADEGGIGG